MDYNLVRKLIAESHIWQTEEITFLGGEPSIYPQIHEAIALCYEHKLRARIVTNGSSAFHRFIQKHLSLGNAPIQACFSFDGASGAHDRIRRKGSCDDLLISIRMCKDAGIPYSGIVSFSADNIDFHEETLRECARMGFQYVNIHYVTNRGFAAKEQVISIRLWQEACRRMKRLANELTLAIRLEDTFVPLRQFSGGCSVRRGSNLIFMPDGRVFQCLLFLDVPEAHSFTWTADGLLPNASNDSEEYLARREFPTHCPAMILLNPELHAAALNEGIAISCVYEKAEFR